MAAIIIPAVVSVLPTLLNIFESAIAAINHSKTPGVKLTPTQAVAANASATQIAQIGVKAAVDTGKLQQSDVDAILPNAQAVSTMTQLVYSTKAAAPPAQPIVSVEQALLIVVQALIARDATTPTK